MIANDFKNILLVKPSSLGDVVLALPALTALRRSFPEAKISWLIRPEFAPLLENHPHLDNILTFDRKFLGKAWCNPRAFGALLSLFRRLKRDRFDLVIDLQGLFRTASLAWLSGCKKRLGMTTSRELAHIFYTDSVPQNQDCVHLVDYYLKIVQAAGASEAMPEFVLPVDPAAIDLVKAMLTNHSVNASNYAVIVPGSRHRDKVWPVEQFAALADRISLQFDSSIVVVGTAAEKDIVEDLQSMANVAIADLVGKTSLGELTALLKTARLVVSNDTGPGHIAVALDTPTVMIFGRSNPARIAPYRKQNCIAAIEPHRRGLKTNSSDPKHDIRDVTFDDVYQKVCVQMSGAD
jgi:lipopolysaccharide heptosyltransferase I